MCLFHCCLLATLCWFLNIPDLKRTFNIPGGKGVKLVVAIVGLLTSIMAFYCFPSCRRITSRVILPICMLNYWLLVSWWYLPCPLFSMLFMIVKAKRIPASLWSNQQSERTKRSLLPAPACTFTTLYCDE